MNKDNLSWKTVALDIRPGGDASVKFSDFAGLEECTDYGSDIEQKKPKKNKNQKKRKNTDTTKTIPDKIIKLVNGFIVEKCGKVKPSTTNNTQNGDNAKNNNEKIQNGKNENITTNKKIKMNLGDKVNQSVSLNEMTSWLQYEIPDEIIRGLADQGFTKPTKIQELTLPTAMLGRRDILGAAETGSGKTLAFGIPILTGIMKLKEQLSAGVDVYEIPYKKTSIKRNVANENNDSNKRKNNSGLHKNKKAKNKENKNSLDSDDEENPDDIEDLSQNGDDNPESRIALDEENESSDVDELDDSIDDSDVNGENNDENDIDLNDEHESNDEEDSKEEDESNDEEKNGDQGIFIPYKKNKWVEEEGDSDDYVHLSEINSFDDDKEDSSNEGDQENKLINNRRDIGCVKVIDHSTLPAHVVVKTGKPLYALILTPTRELAMQVSRHMMAAARYTDIRIAVVVGGLAHVKQERVLSKSPEVVVATPGRLWELIQQGEPHLQQLDHIKFLAIDETDRMVERNHFEELHPLLERINSDEKRKNSRQNFVFSATLTLVHDLPAHLKGKKVTKRGKIINRNIEKMTPQQKIKKLVDMIGMTDPKVVDITTKNLGTAETLTESKVTCSMEQKDYYLHYVLKSYPGRTIVFCNSISSVKRLAQLFSLLNCRPLPLHASMPQRQRLKNLERFRDDPNGVLMSTDVAARGLDIPDIDHVIHYQVPRTAENYVHRSGRTARANKEGLTILMIAPGEAFLYGKLCRTLNKQSEIPTFPIPPEVLGSMKQTVDLAREVERLQMTVRKTSQNEGWLNKAAEEMDMLIDEDFVPRSNSDTKGATKTLRIKKKQLENMLSKPVFPKGFSFKYPSLNKAESLEQKPKENALEVMKKSLQTGCVKKQKRTSKNAPLLKLEKKDKK